MLAALSSQSVVCIILAAQGLTAASSFKLPNVLGEAVNHLTSLVTCNHANTCRYLISLYYVVVTIGTIGYGEITPSNSTEVFISLFIIFIGLVFFGLLLGAIATSLQVCSAFVAAKHLGQPIGCTQYRHRLLPSLWSHSACAHKTLMQQNYMKATHAESFALTLHKLCKQPPFEPLGDLVAELEQGRTQGHNVPQPHGERGQVDGPAAPAKEAAAPDQQVLCRGP